MLTSQFAVGGSSWTVTHASDQVVLDDLAAALTQEFEAWYLVDPEGYRAAHATDPRTTSTMNRVLASVAFRQKAAMGPDSPDVRFELRPTRSRPPSDRKNAHG